VYNSDSSRSKWSFDDFAVLLSGYNVTADVLKIGRGTAARRLELENQNYLVQLKVKVFAGIETCSAQEITFSVLKDRIDFVRFQLTSGLICLISLV